MRSENLYIKQPLVANEYLNRRKTKIVCTIGPATCSIERLIQLVQAGMDVARLNFSHGTHESHGETIASIRKISGELGKEIGILQDLGGPKIRLGVLPYPELRLETGTIVKLGAMVSGTPQFDAADRAIIPVEYPFLMEDVELSDRILLADGLVELKVEQKISNIIICRVLAGGVLHSHKGINLPASKLRVQAMTDKDREDLAFGLAHGIDFVALSFVRDELDLEPIREILAGVECPPLLIAKIEKQDAINKLDNILAIVGGVMVARGDLGVETALEEVPMVQKRIIRLACQSAKPVITATQMLRSMVSSPRPTRAEVADVANAILDGTDALMLSEETAMGDYPIDAVRMLDRIAKATEAHIEERLKMNEPLAHELPKTEAAVSRAANWIAQDLGAAAIVAGTSSGCTARLVARFRPKCPVIGLTSRVSTQRQLSLSWGVLPALVSPFSNTDQLLDVAGNWVVEHGVAKTGEHVVVTSGSPTGIPGTTNLLKVITAR